MAGIRSLRDRLVDKGIQLSVAGEQLVVGKASRLDDADREAIRRYKPQLLNLLSGQRVKTKKQIERPKKGGRSQRGSTLTSFTLAGREVTVHRYGPKMGRVFDVRFALDCETTVVERPAIPELALVAVSDGRSHYLIHPDDIGAFILAHPNPSVVCHNVAFDFWVVHEHLAGTGEQEAMDAWVDVVNRKRLHDTMLLDMLLGIADGAPGAGVQPRDLGTIAREYTNLHVDKDDPYRTRYGELIGADWTKADKGFFEYAAKDAIVTVHAYREMRRQARQEMADAGFDADATGPHCIRPDAVKRFGLLTETIQVGAAIALEAIGRNGMHTDQKRLVKTRRKYEKQVTKLVETINDKFPGFFKLKKDGELQRTKTGAPSRSNKQIDAYLLQAAEEIGEKAGEEIVVPRTPKGEIAKSLDAWEHHLDRHPFLKLWAAYGKATKLSQFVGSLDAAVVRPRYSFLERTGRTGCSNPNMQQVPREDDFREVIVPSPGYLLLAVDYKFIELVTLAATCQGRFGHSQLGDVIAKGIDPHCYTAAMLRGMKYEEFMSLKKSNPNQFKRDRQLAKPINFGVPGGMGSEKLVERAETTYGVKMTKEEADEFRRRLIEDVYPELKLYLEDTSMEILAENLQTSAEDLWARLDRYGERSSAIPGSIRKIVDGNPFKADGTPYGEGYVDRVWAVMNEVNRNHELTHQLAARASTAEISERLFYCSVATLTGRVRGGVTYTSARNTPFQGLGADGAKLALNKLVLSGYRVVGFIHDEVLVELQDEGGYVRREVVEKVIRIMKKSMEQVTGGIPVECEATLATCWSKRAEYIEKKGRVYAWKPPRQKRQKQTP